MDISISKSVPMFLVWVWEQSAIISLQNNNPPVFVTETKNVYCAVRTEASNFIQDNLRRFKCATNSKGVLEAPPHCTPS